AAQGLGNTRAVCREYYVHPTIVKSYETGEITEHFKKVRVRKEKNYQTLSGTEKVMLQMIAGFEIDI
ncbi:MAG TPA: hypothetical protein VK941_09370, partial [Gillisia sp.]|nr:hypothetical protein [Gillisia sp.]